MQTKNIITFVAVIVGLMIGMTALLWNFSSQGDAVITDVAGEMRHAKSFDDAQDKGDGQVVVTEFSDLQCPACSGVQGPLKEVLKQYEGQVKLVFRHLPLTSIHKNAMIAAVFSEAVSEQGKFWEIEELLYARQGEWSELADPESKFLEYATELELDIERLKSDMERDDLKQIVLNDNTDAIRYKIQATPTFFVNGERVEFPGLDAKIKSKLAE